MSVHRTHIEKDNNINPNDSDTELIAKAKKDRKAFSSLYHKYYEQIFLFIFKRVETEALCADLCSQVFLKAITNLHRYVDKGFPFSAWLYRIALNEVNQHYRNHKKMRVISIDRSNLDFLANDESEFELREESLVRLEEALSDLELAELTLIEMRYFEKKSFREIGEILGISEANAKTKTYRAIDALKTKMLKKL